MEILKEIYQFYTFYLKIVSPCGGGVMKFTILFPLQVLHTKFGKDWPSSSWEEDVTRRRERAKMVEADRNIGHLWNSNDPKIIKLLCGLISDDTS